METLISLFTAQPGLSSSLQVALDIIILVMLAAILVGRRHGTPKTDGTVIESFEKIIEQTAQISREFEANLEQRKVLIQQITAKLDQHIQDGRELCLRLERACRASDENLSVLAASPAPSAGHAMTRNGQAAPQKVLLLSRKGLNATEIAKSLNRPLGEIELILSLQKIAP